MVLDGAVSILDLESQYDIALPRDAGFETLAGFILSRLQRIPKVGDSFDYDRHRYTVEEMSGNRIVRVKINAIESAAMEQAGD